MAKRKMAEPLPQEAEASMLLQLSPTTVSLSETPPSESGGNGEPKRPTYKVGPILTDKNSAVECAVWAGEVTSSDGRKYPVHTVTVLSLMRGSDGAWKPTKGFRGSQLYALLYCLQRCSDFILSQRDPANDCPF